MGLKPHARHIGRRYATSLYQASGIATTDLLSV